MADSAIQWTDAEYRTSLVSPPPALRDMSERDWQRQVVQLATMLGWRHFHDLRAKGSDPGWPDLFLLRERPVWLELKSETGKLRPPQAAWLRALAGAGCEAYVVRPRHFDLLARVLAARHRYGDFGSDPAGEAARVAAHALATETREAIT